MKLINCPACGKQVSVDAAACPACGQPIAPAKTSQQGINLKDPVHIIGVIIAGVIIAGICASILAVVLDNIR